MKKLSLILAIVMLVSAFSVVLPVSAAEKYTVSDKPFANFSMNVGSDESERNFIWHSDSTDGYVDFAEKNGTAFPREYTTVQTHLSMFDGMYVHRATIFGLKNDTEYVYTCYVRGCLLFYTVYDNLGETKFFKGLQHYFNQTKLTLATPQQLIDSFCQGSKKDVSGIFNAFIQGKDIISQGNR